MASPFNYPPPEGAPNANGSNPLRPFYGVSGESPLQPFYHLESFENDFTAQQQHQQELNSQEATRELLRYGAIKFVTIGLAVPFENAQTLLQVQYLPTDEHDNGDDSEDARAEQVRVASEKNDDHEKVNVFEMKVSSLTSNNDFIRSDAMKNSDAHRKKKRKKKTTTSAVDQQAIRDITAASAVAAETASLRPVRAPLVWTPVQPSSTSAKTLISLDIWSAPMFMMRSRDPPSSCLP